MKKLVLIWSFILSFLRVQNISAECIYQCELYGEDLSVWNDQLIVSGMSRNQLDSILVVGQTYRVEMVYCSGGNTYTDSFSATYTCTADSNSEEIPEDADYGTLSNGYSGFYNIYMDAPSEDYVDDEDAYNENIYRFHFETDNTTISHIWIYVYE